jgi:hypothetical protein
MECYALRRDKWMELADEYPEMTLEVKRHLVQTYDNDIRKPLLEYKM